MLTRDDQHRYWLNGKRVWGVTEVLSPYSAFARMNDEAMEVYRERGRAVHAICDLYNKGKLNETALDNTGAGYLNAWKSFLRDSGFQSLLSEQIMYSAMYHYAGQMDIYGEMNIKGKTKRVIVDIKTGQPDVTASLQTAAYANLIRENLNEAVDARYVVMLDGISYKLFPYINASDFKVFVAMLLVNNWKFNYVKA